MCKCGCVAVVVAVRSILCRLGKFFCDGFLSCLKSCTQLSRQMIANSLRPPPLDRYTSSLSLTYCKVLSGRSCCDDHEDDDEAEEEECAGTASCNSATPTNDASEAVPIGISAEDIASGASAASIDPFVTDSAVQQQQAQYLLPNSHRFCRYVVLEAFSLQACLQILISAFSS